MPERTLFKIFRRQFTTGLLVLLPVITTIFLVTWFFRALDQILGRYFARLFGGYIHGVGFVSLILLIWLVGAISRTYIGGKLNHFKDRLLARIPLIGSIFGSIKQVSEALMQMDPSNFEQVVMIEYPRKGLYAVGFVTSKRRVDFESPDSGRGTEKVVHVFVPTVPNPTSGFIFLVPENEAFRLNITVEEGLKLVLSLGMIHPDQYRLKTSPAPSPESARTGNGPAAP